MGSYSSNWLLDDNLHAALHSVNDTDCARQTDGMFKAVDLPDNLKAYFKHVAQSHIVKARKIVTASTSTQYQEGVRQEVENRMAKQQLDSDHQNMAFLLKNMTFFSIYLDSKRPDFNFSEVYGVDCFKGFVKAASGEKYKK